MEASSSGTFNFVNLKKTFTCKWDGNVKPKNKSYKIRLNLHINKDRMEVDVDTSMNADGTMNVFGDVTTTHGKKTMKKHIDVKNYNVKNVNKQMLQKALL